MIDIFETHDCQKPKQSREPQKTLSKQSLSEAMRPQTLSDLILPIQIIERLQKMIETNSIMNMLFYGKVGTGKTSAACLFKGCADLSVFRWRMFRLVDGLSVKNVDFVKKDMMHNIAGFQIVVLDRADLIPKTVQQALPSVIESSDSTRFILAVNDISKIIPEIRSGLVPICFDIKPSDREEVQKRLICRYESKLAEFGISYDTQSVTEIIGANYPDLRSIAQKIEFEFA